MTCCRYPYMGQLNSNGTNQTVSDDIELTKQEQNLLQQKHNNIFHVSKNASKLQHEDINTIFGFKETNLFSEIFLTGMLVKDCFKYQNFELLIVNLCRISDQTTVETFWNLIEISQPKTKLLENFFYLIIFLTECLNSNHELNETKTKIVAKQIEEFFRHDCEKNNIMLYEDKESNFQQLSNWIQKSAPAIPNVICTYMSNIFLDAKHSLSFKPFQLSCLTQSSSILEEVETSPLGLFCGGLQGTWTRLYTTNSDGLSFNRVVHHVLGYEGPTCILIKTTATHQRNVFGVYAHDRWRESNRFYGSSNTILFTLCPKLRIYRSKNANDKSFQWLNTKSFGLPHGMGFGGTIDGFRLFIPDSLENCYANTDCPTFQSGTLLFNNLLNGNMINNNQFEIDQLEIWGCGGIDIVQRALEAQSKQRDIVNENIQKARKVDKAQFFNNEFDKEFLLSGTFNHQKQQEKR